MKTFSFSPIFIAGALAATISGCAATGGNLQGDAKPPMMMDKDSCACCAMHKGGMLQGMNNKPMEMVPGNDSPVQGGMCSPNKDGHGKGGGGCCGDMGKLDGTSCACCGMDKNKMSPDMHKQHMGMIKRHHPEMNPGRTPVPSVTK